MKFKTLMMVKKEKEQLVCQKCDKIYTSSNSFAKHIVSHEVKDDASYIFRKKFTNEFKLDAVKLAEEKGLKQASLELKIQTSTLKNWLTLCRDPKTCQFCGKVFPYNLCLEKHINGSHENLSKKKPQVRNYKKEFKMEAAKYAIETSLEKSAEKYGVPQGTLRSWVKIVESPFVCDFCGYCVAIKTALNIHMQRKHKVEINNADLDPSATKFYNFASAHNVGEIFKKEFSNQEEQNDDHKSEDYNGLVKNYIKDEDKKDLIKTCEVMKEESEKGPENSISDNNVIIKMKLNIDEVENYDNGNETDKLENLNEVKTFSHSESKPNTLLQKDTEVEHRLEEMENILKELKNLNGMKIIYHPESKPNTLLQKDTEQILGEEPNLSDEENESVTEQNIVKDGLVQPQVEEADYQSEKECKTGDDQNLAIEQNESRKEQGVENEQDKSGNLHENKDYVMKNVDTGSINKENGGLIEPQVKEEIHQLQKGIKEYETVDTDDEQKVIFNICENSDGLMKNTNAGNTHEEIEGFMEGLVKKEVEHHLEEMENILKEHDLKKEQTYLLQTPTTVSMDVLKKGNKKSYPGVIFECKECGYIPKKQTKKNAKKHMKMHNRPFVKSATVNLSCTHCEKKFTAFSNLKRHEMTHSSERNWQCDVCTSRFVQFAHLKRHKEIHEESREKVTEMCKFCGGQFTSKHSRDVHELRHTGTFLYFCDHCEKGFNEKSVMRKHKAKTHADKSAYSVFCEKCGKGFVLLSALESHTSECGLKKTKAKKKRTSSHPCSSCTKIFDRSSNLERHLKVHSGVKDYSCSTCGKFFRDKRSIDRHEEKKHGTSIQA